MNLLDIIILGLLVLSLVGGMFGKLRKQLIHLIFVVISIPVSYFLAKWFATLDLFDKLIEKFDLTEIVETLNEASPQFASIFGGVKIMLSFFVIGIVLFLVFGLIAGFICSISKDKTTKKGILLLGLVPVVKTAIILAFIAIPVASCRVIAKDVYKATMDNSMSEEEKEELANSKFAIILESKALDLEEDVLETGKVPFLTYKVNEEVDGEEKEVSYYFYSDMKDIEVCMPAILKIKSMNFGSLSLDMNNAESFTNLLNLVEEILDEVDSTRSKLSEGGHLSKLFGDAIKYAFNKLPDKDSKFAFLKNGVKYLEGYDYYNANYKDKLPSVIVQSYIDSLNESMSLTKHINVSNFTFEELRQNVTKLPELVSLFNTTGNKTQEEVNNALTSSTIAKQVISGVLNDYYTDGSVNETELNYNDESYAIASALNYANSNDNSAIDAVSLVDALSKSDLLPALIDSYNKDGKGFEVKVDAVKKAALDAAIDLKVVDGSLTTQQANTYKALFVVE